MTYSATEAGVAHEWVFAFESSTVSLRASQREIRGLTSYALILTTDGIKVPSLADEAVALDYVLKTLLGKGVELKRIAVFGVPAMHEVEAQRRLVAAALRSEEWSNYVKSRKGVGFPKTIPLVVDLLERSDAYAELREVFKKHGLGFVPSAVEGVLVARVSEIDVQIGHDEHDGSKHVPYRCMAWFSVNALQ